MAQLQTIKNAGDVLGLFNRQHPEWGVTEAARALGIAKSNSHQLLDSLESIGLLHRMVTGRYRLGFRLLVLGQYLLANTAWRDVASRALTELNAQTGETVQLAVLDGGQLIFIKNILSHKTNLQAPEVLPHKNALGWVLLASKPQRVAMAAHKQKPGRKKFMQELNRIATQGFAEDLEKTTCGVCALAAPIRNHNGDVIAAIGLSVTAKKLMGVSPTHKRNLLETAKEISAAIGYNPEFVRDNRAQSRKSGRV